LQGIEAALRANSSLTLFKRNVVFDTPRAGDSQWWGLVQHVDFVTYGKMRSATKDKMWTYMENLALGCDDVHGHIFVRDDGTGSISFDEVIGRELAAPVLHITDPDIVLPREYNKETRKLVVKQAETYVRELTRRISVYVYPTRASAAGVHGWSELTPLEA